jgi:hypothetical protein
MRTVHKQVTVDNILMKSEAQVCNEMLTEGPDCVVLIIHTNCSNRFFLLNFESDFEYLSVFS